MSDINVNRTYVLVYYGFIVITVFFLKFFFFSPSLSLCDDPNSEQYFISISVANTIQYSLLEIYSFKCEDLHVLILHPSIIYFYFFVLFSPLF